jgi:hypothetical protein
MLSLHIKLVNIKYIWVFGKLITLIHNKKLENVCFSDLLVLGVRIYPREIILTAEKPYA